MRFGPFIFGSLSILALLTLGCGGQSSQATGIAPSVLTPTGKVLPFTSVQATKPGALFFIILDRPRGKIQAAIKLSGSTDDANGREILFTSVNQAVGAGDAGSLIIDTKGNSVGALDSVGLNDLDFVATAIEDEQSILLSAGAAKRKALSSKPGGDGLVHIVRGISPYLWGIMSKDPKNKIPKNFTLDTSSSTAQTVKQPMTGSSLYSTSAYMVESYGDAYLAFTIGAVTTPYQGVLLCLGHPLSWEGAGQNIPVYAGTLTQFQSNPVYGAELVGTPNMNAPLGTLTGDFQFGVVVDPTVMATPVPITGSITVNANAPVNFTGNIAQDQEYEYSMAISNIAAGTENILDAVDTIGSSTGTATINYMDGTSQSVDLTATDVPGVIEYMYENIEEALYSYLTNIAPPLQSISFDFEIVSGTYPKAPKGGRPAQR